MPRRNYGNGRRRPTAPGDQPNSLLARLQAELGNRPPRWQERREEERRSRPRNASTRQNASR